jgi:hypothetical protein
MEKKKNISGGVAGGARSVIVCKGGPKDSFLYTDFPTMPCV